MQHHCKVLLLSLVLLPVAISEPLSWKYPPLLTQINATQAERENADALFQEGLQQYNTSQFQAAMESWQAVLEIYQRINDHSSAGDTINAIGILWRIAGQSQRAIEYHRQALIIARTTENRAGEGRALSNLGLAYASIGKTQQAIEYYNQDLEIALSISDRGGEGRALGNLANAYVNLGQYQEAISLYEQRLEIAHSSEDRTGEGRTLGNLGSTYTILGQYQRAINLYEQQLLITREVGDRSGEGAALGNLGIAYRNLGQYQRAIDLFGQQLMIAQEIGERAIESAALGSLGSVYINLGEYQRAIDLFEQQLKLSQEIRDPVGESRALGNLGVTYVSLGQYSKAIEFYEKDLIIAREIGDLAGEGVTLNNLGFLYETYQRPSLSIILYKQSVNTRKQVSQVIRDPRLRQSYAERIFTGTYHRLADLLLTQGRTTESFHLIELLKVQELSEYTNQDQGLSKLPDLALLPEEAQVWDAYNQLLTAKQTNSEEEAAQQSYQAAVSALEQSIPDPNSPEIAQATDFFIDKVQAIVAAQPGTVVIYPLVLNDKLWLLWTNKAGFGSHQVSDVGQSALSQTVTAFRQAVENRNSGLDTLQADARQLYNWLIAPVEAALGDDLRHLVLALDGTARYLPIAALHDGEQYLVEKYSIATILAASLTSTESRFPLGPETVDMLAAGVSRGFESFHALPYVPIELNSIVRDPTLGGDDTGVYPGRQLLDDTFTLENLQANLAGKTLLHIATHGEFIPGNRYASYLLLGNGERLLIPEIANLGSALSNVHLVVLSACQTGLGGADEEGLEIAGLGYYFFQNQVDAVMASLWNVSDSSTSHLMRWFYQILAEGTATQPITKAEALRQAQLAMLRSNQPGADNDDRFIYVPRDGDASPPTVGVAHPYYWAPFILIGNSL